MDKVWGLGLGPGTEDICWGSLGEGRWKEGGSCIFILDLQGGMKGGVKSTHPPCVPGIRGVSPGPLKSATPPGRDSSVPRWPGQPRAAWGSPTSETR